jgi:methionyl-tRNA synthetase
VEAGFAAVGEHIEAARFKAALGEAMALARRVNVYVNDQAPWALLESDRDRAATVLYTCLRCVNDLKTMFTPFMPFSSQALHELLGNEGVIAGPLEFRDVEDDGDTHVVLTGDYDSWEGSWAPSELAPGQALREPKPLFRKLDAAKVEAEELERMGVQDPEAA